VRVAKRAGFRLEGELRNAEVGADGEPRNVLVFSMIPGEHEAAQSKSPIHPTS
jgi:RimJ/RimL family protein N-acetyltransferase